MRPERLLGILLVLAAAATLVAVVALLWRPDSRSAAPGDRGPAPGAVAARLLRVVDGDTIVVEIDGRRERVRYVGVDAPELANVERDIPAECGGEAARSANEALVEGVLLWLERDSSDRDRFGRLLRHAWIEGDGGWQLVAEELVASGALEARTYPPDTAHDRRLETAEAQARGGALGIWGAC